MITSRIAWGRLDRTPVFLLSFSQLRGLHCSSQVLLPGSFLCIFAVICNIESYSLCRAEKLGDKQAMETSFFNYDLELEVVWETGLKRLLFHGCSASVSALKTLRQCWTKQFCRAPSWQQELCVEITKQPVQKQEEIPCPRMWLQTDWKRELVKPLLCKETNIYSDKDESLPCSRAYPPAGIRREFPSRLFMALQLRYCNAVV